jgi:hypothetical protein
MRRVYVLAAVVALLGGVGVVAVDRTRDELAAIEACDAVQRGDAHAALTLTEGRVGTDAAGRTAAECRCLAQLASGDAQACDSMMSSLLRDPRSAGWAPGPALSTHLIQEWRDAGRAADAADLAKRAGALHPTDPGLFHLELATRSTLEDEQTLLHELAARVPDQGESAARMRASLAQRHLRRGDAGRALRALGPEMPVGADSARGLWFDTLGIAHAMTGDIARTRAAYDAWIDAGGRRVEVRARYALALSIAGLEDPEIPVLERLQRSVDDGAALDPVLHETLAIRLILTLVSAGRLDEALSAHDHHSEDVPLEGLQRAEIERAVLHRQLEGTPPAQRRGRLRFTFPADGPTLRDGARLLVSPSVDAPPDAPWSVHPIVANAALEIERSAGVAPQRWVVRDTGGATLASGTVSPRPGETLDVRVTPGPPHARPSHVPGRAPADGRRRVALLLLDCADWRIAQYLRTRGDLPVLDALLREGHRAVLASDPPLTAAALESLVWPDRRSDASFVGVVHRMGVELAGLSSIGDNPFGALSWVLPESDDLFAVIGARDRSAANLLLAHGGIRAGRHGEVTGPRGVRRLAPIGAAERDLDADERRRFPALGPALPERDAVHVRTIAAEFDATLDLLQDDSIDLVAVRIEPLDILTHAHFGETVLDGQDDGAALLYEVYRYVDHRVGAISNALDADDVLLVLSDHGIRTAMQHDRHALFVAHGGGVPAGRAEGLPDLRGVSRVVADLLEVRTHWPETGIARWLDARPAAPSR